MRSHTRAWQCLSLLCVACDSSTPDADSASSVERADASAEVARAAKPPYSADDAGAPEPVCFELRTHGGSAPGDTTAYDVQSGEHLETFHFSAPYADAVQAVAFEPMIDHPEVVKRMFLYDTTRASEPAGSHGFEVVHLNTELLYVWAEGLGKYALRSNVGARLPKPGGSLALEVHYWNTADKIADRSGLRVCTTNTPREHEASLMVLGTEQIALSGARGDVKGECKFSTQDSASAVLVSVLPHMHRAGRHAQLAVAPAGDTQNKRVLLDGAFDFKAHAFIETMATLRAGDVLHSSCSYERQDNLPLSFGPSLDLEECYFFAFTFPGAAWNERVQAVSGIENACLTP